MEESGCCEGDSGVGVSGESVGATGGSGGAREGQQGGNGGAREGQQGMARREVGSGSNGTCIRLLFSRVAGIAFRFYFRFPDGTAVLKGVVIEGFPRNFAVNAFLRGRGWAVTVGVITRCTVRTASD